MNYLKQMKIKANQIKDDYLAELHFKVKEMILKFEDLTTIDFHKKIRFINEVKSFIITEREVFLFDKFSPFFYPDLISDFITEKEKLIYQLALKYDEFRKHSVQIEKNEYINLVN